MNAVYKFSQLIFAILMCFSAFAQKENSTILANEVVIVSDTSFVNLRDYNGNFVYDLKYATEDNFLKEKVYDCAECFLRLKTVKALLTASKLFEEDGYTIKLFDCYRSLDVQKKMWKIVSNPSYVANPAIGSIHNRGKAVDITLVDAQGIELEMGTNFDFFGAKAAHNYKRLSKKVLRNRSYLKSIMIKSGFSPLASEWWHYNLNDGATDPVANFNWNCN